MPVATPLFRKNDLRRIIATATAMAVKQYRVDITKDGMSLIVDNHNGEPPTKELDDWMAKKNASHT